MSIGERLKKLHPYVVGIRFTEGLPVIDCVFNEYWTVNGTNLIHFVQNGTADQHMCYSEAPSITIDSLLDYVEQVIKLNLDEEAKATLFRSKLNELKEFFENNSLDKVKKLQFVVGELQPAPQVSKFDLSKEDLDINLKSKENIGQTYNENCRDDNYNESNRNHNHNESNLTQQKPTRIEFDPNMDVLNKVIEPVCRCKGDERCSVCMGFEM